MRIEPVVLNALRPRHIRDVADMAIAVQANLVQLKVLECRRAGVGPHCHAIQTPPPGAVTRFREALIPHETIACYDDIQLQLRTREVWGQFSMFCWFFHVPDPQHPPDFKRLPERQQVHCPASASIKTLEVTKSLWRLRFEQRLRSSPEFRSDPGFDDAYQTASRIPVMVMGCSAAMCDDASLLLGTCEFAGMLAAARWISDDRWGWGEPGIMDLPGDVAV